MRWRFYLIDRNGVKNRIEEPGGWDSFTLKIKRHAERHGTFRELQATQFKFVDDAVTFLKTEHKQYGARGIYDLVIDGRCGSGWQQVYRGRVAFDTYRFVCGDYCYVSIQVDQIGALIDFINRFDQKADLSSSTGFDGAALTDYNGLSKQITLPSKAILLRVNAKNVASQEYKISDDSGWFPVSSTGTMQGGLNVPFDTVDTNAIKDFEANAIIDYYNTSNDSDYFPELIYNNPDQDLNCNGQQFSVEFRVKGTYKNLVNGSGTHIMTLALKKGKDNFTTPGVTQLQGWILTSASNNDVANIAFDKSWSGVVTLQPGEKLWLNFFLTYVKNTNYAEDVRLQIDVETYFKASVVSKCDSTTAKLTMINEAASRVTEAITNNQLKVYSEYYGRTDSEPYAMAANGCGSLRAIATGLDIRRAKLADGSDPKMFLSMKDVFESLAAIDNIGVGPEGDDKIRIEPWKFFYQDDVIFTCRNIQSIERATKADDLYSIFKTGYEKWESEDYNGLDEFLTKREYRTSLTNIQKTLEKVCKWIASGYAWEVTRRKTDDSKDWRYDNDTFIVCLTDYFKGAAAFTSATNSFNIIPGEDGIISIGDIIEVSNTASNNGTFTVTNVVQIANSIQVYVSGTFVSESAPAAVIRNTTTPIYRVEVKSITAAANILDPDTVYNYRISPARNAMRWFDFVAKCYKNIASADKLIFSAADGNYVASGLLADVSGCAQEAAAIAENADISLDSFADPSEGTPVTEPERVVFKYGISFTEYNQITASPYGLIEFISPCERGQGWIDEIEYNPEDGTAKFTLIPKVQ